MNDNYENNSFFGYYGVIGRKNYIINSLILIALFIALMFIDIPKLMQYSQITFLSYVLDFVIGCFKFVIVFSLISLAYRRISDISEGKSENFQINLKRVYGVLYIYPILAYCFGPFLNFIPGLNNALLWSIVFIIPFTLLFSIVISFIKGSNKQKG